MIKLPDPEQFNFKDCVIAGDECVLVTPKDMGVEWNDENKIFRSSIWHKKTGKLISGGFKKFVNLGEASHFEPWDDNQKFTTIQKLDGSLAIISKFNGELIFRTRGTVNASLLSNGHEIEYFKNKYPKVFNNNILNSEEKTLLFEWTTPTNRIVFLESNVPKLSLIGIVNHSDYSYVSQKELDIIAEDLEVDRPKTYKDWTMEEIRPFLKGDKSIEGFVIYSEDGQILKKLKTEHYLYLHRVFTGVKTVDNLFELWKESNYLFYGDFKEYLAEQYDHELVVSLNELINDLFVIRDNISVLAKGIHEFVNQKGFKELQRKEQAQQIMKTWGDWSSLAFNILDKDDFCWEKTYKMYRKLNS